MEYYVLRKDKFHREAIAGSEAEHQIASAIKEYFKEYSDWVKILKVPLDTWEEINCTISFHDNVLDCKSMPFTLSGEVEGEPVFADYLGNKIVSNKQVSDSIVFIPFPDDPDDSKYVVLKLYEHGAKAVVFYDILPGRYRRMVIIGDEDYSFSHGAPSPIPVASIKKEDYLRIYKEMPRRIVFRSKTKITHNVHGYTVVAGINGRGDREIHVTAHHDHWFNGFSDNMVGVELLIQLMKKYRKSWNGYNLVFISYTAEESGSPYFTSWYWIWGSRYYLELLEARNDTSKIIADVNVDAIYTYPLHFNANPSLTDCINKLVEGGRGIYDGYDYTDFDSYSYTLHGIPAMTLHTFKEMKHIYHTNLDDGSEVYDHIITNALETLDDTVRCINNNMPKYKHITKYIKEKLGDKAPLEARNLVSKLETINNKINEEASIRIITRELSSIIYVPSLDGLFTSDLLADIIEIIDKLDKIDQYIGKRIRVKVVDREQFLDISPTNHNKEELLKSLQYALIQRINSYNRRIEDVIKNIVLRKKCEKQL
ncbi:aminopeptidase Iap family-like protein [Staphylothermus marinus F1]|uniref:Aminopeptidase Iap family-like protein n=1 Tax=Staphylothermus marinus (strain ATCC 43588 / DSM 3639 / JCM 9404 / F1) TaxID=399550 RepID=A3DNP9_STAMF|nr:M28 family peptidase [Staphylothermus marinus]ABN70259.1 aminopeptidase Iap family-like protein [Staphylothermus marinus F1]